MSMIIEKAATFNDDLSVDMSADNFLSGRLYAHEALSNLSTLTFDFSVYQRVVCHAINSYAILNVMPVTVLELP